MVCLFVKSVITKKKKQIIRVRSSKELGNPIANIKLDIIKGITKTENKNKYQT